MHPIDLPFLVYVYRLGVTTTKPITYCMDYRRYQGKYTAISERYIPETTAKRCKQRRKLFTKMQILELEHRFRYQQYLSAFEREQLAELINLSANQVRFHSSFHEF